VTVGALPLDPWPAVAAAGACPVPPPSAQPPPGTQPWAQQRFDLARLASFADGHDVKVAVIDSGVDPDHPQMRGHVLAGADFIDPQGDGRQDCIGHGTAVASLIVAQPIANIPFRGLAPGASIMSIRVSEQENTQGGVSGRVPPGRVVGEALEFLLDARLDEGPMSEADAYARLADWANERGIEPVG
jgi:subtilisin family serine protease